MAWARTIVVGLNLCPFAAGALDRARVRVVVTPAVDEKGMSEIVRDEIELLIELGRDVVETTLIVAPGFATHDFLRFHAFGEALEDEIEKDERLIDAVMAARFHPEHAWADANSHDDPVNFDKRAPYPIVNLLRADDVDRYVGEGLTDGILERNSETLASVGSDKLRGLYDALVEIEP
jgi:uncharacterized protein